jgi:hypothetical protein
MELKNHFIRLFHLIAIFHYGYAIYYDVVFVFPEEIKIRKHSFGGKFIYLTFWDTVSKNVTDESSNGVNYCIFSVYS